MPFSEAGRPNVWRGGWLLVMALAATGCANYIGTTATSFMHRVRDSPDPNIRHLAYSKLANPYCFDDEQQKAEAAKLLSLKLDEKAEPIITRAVICRTLGEIGRPEARESLLRATLDPEPLIRGAACRALGKIGTAEDSVKLAHAMLVDNDPDVRIAAIEGIKELKQPDERVITVLVDNMESPDPAIRLASYEALQRSTGKDLGPDPEPWKKMVDEMVEASAKQQQQQQPPQTEASPAPSTANPPAPPSASAAPSLAIPPARP